MTFVLCPYYSSLISALVLLLWLFSNGITATTSTTTSASSATSAATSPRSAVWGPCSWETSAEVSAVYHVECATLDVPLDHAHPSNSEVIPYHVIGVRPVKFAKEQLMGQFWMLNGGPGTPGGWLLPFTTIPSESPLPVWFVLPDHRGTGLSAELTCEDGSQDVHEPSCLAYLQSQASRLRHFTVTNAAKDIYLGMTQLRQGLPIVLMGTSYGTELANRFLQIYPDFVAMVVLDSVVNPATVSSATLDVDANSVGNAFLQKCEEDHFCGDVIFQGKSVRQLLRNLILAIQEGKQPCIQAHWPYLSGLAGAARLRSALSGLLFQASEYYNRLTIPAFGYRLNRCSQGSGDVKAITRYFERLGLTEIPSNTPPSVPGMPSYVRQSLVLNSLIQLSENYIFTNELRPKELTVAHVEAWERNLTFSSGFELKFARLLAAGYPTYAPDHYHRKIASPACPVLMINGDLDSATLVQYVRLLHQARPSWYFEPLPLLGHSPSGGAAAGITCPMELLTKFMMNPGENPYASESSCVRQLPRQFDFEGTVDSQRVTSLAQEFFSSPTLFG